MEKEYLEDIFRKHSDIIMERLTEVIDARFLELEEHLDRLEGKVDELRLNLLGRSG
jgi:hypothetical protein